MLILLLILRNSLSSVALFTRERDFIPATRPEGEQQIVKVKRLIQSKTAGCPFFHGTYITL